MRCKEIELQEDVINYYKKQIYVLESLKFKDEDVLCHIRALKKYLGMLESRLEEMVSLSKKRLTPLIRRR